MNKKNLNHKSDVGTCYSLFKAYLRFINNKIYYRKTYNLEPENIPENGTAVIVVGNHQNCLNDIFGILFNINDRKVRFLTRGDVFALSPIVAKFLYSIGLMPTFRLAYEGAENLGKNRQTFDVIEKALLEGSTIGMYPEAGHQNKRWLGDFSYGYLKMAFEAAEKSGFEKDIVILPSASHYSDYFGIRNDYMVKFGTPVSLKPFYELYKTKPRTAQRQANALVREQIHNMMLDIRDLDHYEQIDFLRNTYGIKYAQSAGIHPEILPEKLESDKKFVNELAQAGPETTEKIYQDTKKLMEELQKYGIADRNLSKAPSAVATLLKAAGMIAILPMWIASLWPSLPMYLISKGFAKRTNDIMFEGTFLFAISVLFTIPIFGLLTIIVLWCTTNWWIAMLWAAAFLPLVIFAWDYAKWAKRLFQDIRALFLGKKRKGLTSLRSKIHSELDKICKGR